MSNPAGDESEIAVRRSEAHAVTQTSDSFDGVYVPPGIAEHRIAPHGGVPELGIARVCQETGGDSDDCAHRIVQRDLPAEHTRVASEVVPPRTVRQDHDLGSVPAVLAGDEGPTELRLHAEEGEER